MNQPRCARARLNTEGANLSKRQSEAPEPTPQNSETQRRGSPKRPKNGPKDERSQGRKVSKSL